MIRKQANHDASEQFFKVSFLSVSYILKQ